MSDFSQDDLNAFFKGKLDNADPDSNMWNVPPDFVFDNAMQRMNASNHNKRSGNKKWLLLLLIPFGIITGLYVNNLLSLQKINEKVEILESEVGTSKKQIDKLENKIALQKSDFAKLLEEKTEKENKLIDIENEKLSISQNSRISSTKIITSYSKPKMSINKKSKSSFDNKIEVPNFPNMESIPFQNLDNDINVSNLKGSIGFRDEKEFINSIKLLPRLNLIKMFEIQSKEPRVELPAFVFDLSEANRNLDTDVIRYGILTRQNFSSLRMTGMNNGIDLTSFDNSYSGFGLSLQMQKSISPKFDMQFSVGYDLINNSSQLEQMSFYDKGNEVEMPDGSMSYSMDVDMETPFGAVKAHTDFTIDPNLTLDQDPMDQLTQTSQSLNVLSLNIGPKFKWFESKDWEIFSTASLGYNRILHYENELNTSIKMNDKTMVEFRATPPKIYDINKNFLSVQLGFGFGFKFSDNIQLAMSANYGRSLNSLRIARTTIDPTTYLKQWNSQIGLNFSF